MLEKKTTRAKREKLYNTWTDLKRRAKKKNVNVEEEWMNSYSAFKEWALGNGYVEGMVSLVRVVDTLGYEPSNCKYVEKHKHMQTHGRHDTKLYQVWASMKQKSNNSNNPHFKSFGGKGIKICKEWNEFFQFQKWAEQNGYREGLLLDRKDLKGDFTPSNCIFTVRNEHSNVKQSPIINKKGIKNPGFKHGQHNSRIYNIWDTMKQRCFNPNQKDYKNYGGRGITVCKQWNEFINFYNWAMDNGYKVNLTIERRDVNGNYEPSNCLWATIQQQARNTRKNHFVAYKGGNKNYC